MPVLERTRTTKCRNQTSSRTEGDADLDAGNFSDLVVPDCPDCGGVLKPDVVLFGESAPRGRLGLALSALDRADAMLAVSSS